MHKKTLIWACLFVTFLHSCSTVCCRVGDYGRQQIERERYGGRITNSACHMVKQRRFMTDRVPHRQHGVVASECQVWEWDQTPALVCTPFLATAARVTGQRWQSYYGLVLGTWSSVVKSFNISLVAKAYIPLNMQKLQKKKLNAVGGKLKQNWQA